MGNSAESHVSKPYNETCSKSAYVRMRLVVKYAFKIMELLSSGCVLYEGVSKGHKSGKFWTICHEYRPRSKQLPSLQSPEGAPGW